MIIDWPRTWIQTKVALIDSFHMIVTALFNDLSFQSTQVEKDRVFDTLFALLDLGVAHPTTPSTPYLDHPLIADYHHAYNLSDKLSTTLMPPNSAAERDPRLDRLETSFAIHPPFRVEVEEREDHRKIGVNSSTRRQYVLQHQHKYRKR